MEKRPLIPNLDLYTAIQQLRDRKVYNFKACPMCGSDNILFMPEEPSVWLVKCGDCGCKKSIFINCNEIEQIFIQWNERAVKPNRVAFIPEGYRWCADCEAITPHVPEDTIPYKSNFMTCYVCGDRNYGDGCSNCGWWDENVIEAPLIQNVIVHHPGCHFHESWNVQLDENDPYSPFWDAYAYKTAVDFFNKNFADFKYSFLHPDNQQYNRKVRIMELWQYHTSEMCGCPTHIIRRYVNTWDHWSRQTYDGDWEGGMMVKCPVCGDEFYYDW